MELETPPALVEPIAYVRSFQANLAQHNYSLRMLLLTKPRVAWLVKLFIVNYFNYLLLSVIYIYLIMCD